MTENEIKKHHLSILLQQYSNRMYYDGTSIQDKFIQHLIDTDFDLNKDHITEALDSLIEGNINELNNPQVFKLGRDGDRLIYIKTTPEYAAKRLLKKYNLEYSDYRSIRDHTRLLFYYNKGVMTKEEIQFCAENQAVESPYHIEEYFLGDHGEKFLTKKQIKYLEDIVINYYK